MTTFSHVDDSHLHCVCGQRMYLSIGADETTGEVEFWHVCWGCGRSERDRVWLVDMDVRTLLAIPDDEAERLIDESGEGLRRLAKLRGDEAA